MDTAEGEVAGLPHDRSVYVGREDRAGDVVGADVEELIAFVDAYKLQPVPDVIAHVSGGAGERVDGIFRQPASVAIEDAVDDLARLRQAANSLLAEAVVLVFGLDDAADA